MPASSTITVVPAASRYCESTARVTGLRGEQLVVYLALYSEPMDARRPNLAKYPGRYVALDLASDEVLADAATMIEIIEIVRSRGLKASIVRAQREGEPVLVGLG